MLFIRVRSRGSNALNMDGVWGHYTIQGSWLRVIGLRVMKASWNASADRKAIRFHRAEVIWQNCVPRGFLLGGGDVPGLFGLDEELAE